jgi:hypothetical protein
VTRRLLLIIGSLLFLSACASKPSVSPVLRQLPESVELSSVPFFVQHAYQSAPAALASLLIFNGEVTTPGLLEAQLELPQRQDNLAQRLPIVAMEHGLLVYPLQPKLGALLTQVAAGNPVLLRLHQGFGWMASERYAVLVGYERNSGTVLLRLAGERRATMTFSDFEPAWAAAGHWAVLLQSPDRLPADAQRSLWLEGVQRLRDAGQDASAARATKTASAAWPNAGL